MIYINLKTATLRSPGYIGAEPVQRATWLSLLAHCCEQENLGRIEGAGAWKCRQWQQTCGVTLAEVQDACDLWTWDGAALVVQFYPTEKQAEVQAKREAGRKGGRSTSQAKREANAEHGFQPAEGELEASRQAQLEAEREANGKHAANGKERKGIGRESDREKSACAGEGSNGQAPEAPPAADQTPTLAEVLEAAKLASIPADHATQFFNACEARPFAPSGGWTTRDGQPMNMARWRNAMAAYSASMARTASTRPAGSGGRRAAPSKFDNEF